MLESRASQYNEIIPMCKRVVSGGIGFPLLLALETGAIKKTEDDGLPVGAAPFRIMQDIEDYNRHGGMKKKLYEILMQVNTTREFLGAPKRRDKHFHEIAIVWNDRRSDFECV